MTTSAELLRSLLLDTAPTNVSGSGGGGGNYTEETLTFTGDLITDAVREAGEEGDGLTPPAGVGIWPAATNLITNGGFETNFTGWVAENESGGTSGRSTDASLFGSASAYFIATTPADNAGIRMTTSVAAASGSTFTASAFIRSLDTTELALRIAEYDTGDNFLRLGAAVHAEFTDDGEFTRITATATMGASTTQARLFINTWGSQSAEFYVDGIQFEAGSIATPYIETDGGTASRTAGRVQQPDTDDLMTEAQGWVYGATRFGIANTALSTGIAVLWQWLDDTDNFLRVAYDWQNNRVSFIRRAAGVQTESTVAATFAAQGLLTWGADWTATEIAAIANGTRATPSADTNIPTLTATAGDIGSNAGSASFLLGNDRSFETGSGTLTDADAAALNAFGDTPPTWAQIKGALPATAALTSLWPAVDQTFSKVAS